jgi:acyl dehydratase
MLTAALMARVVKDWFGPEAMRRYKVRFAKQVWPGDTLTFTATVTGKYEEGGDRLVDLDLTATNQDGVEVLTGAATAAVGG